MKQEKEEKPDRPNANGVIQSDPSQIIAGSFIAADKKPFRIRSSVKYSHRLYKLVYQFVVGVVFKHPFRLTCDPFARATHDLQSIAQFIIYGGRLFCINLLYFSSETSTLPHRLKSKRARVRTFATFTKLLGVVY